jgi:hypothetical protein
MSKQLHEDFDLFFGVKTFEELDDFMSQKVFELCLLMELVDTHNIDSEKLPKTCKIIEDSPFNLDI